MSFIYGGLQHDSLHSSKIEILDGRCSWCFQATKHNLIEHSVLGMKRGLYQCGQCQNDTVVCRGMFCADFARSVPEYREKHCYVHRGVIRSWDDTAGIASLNPTKYCSYCFSRGKQTLVICVSGSMEKVYDCTNCHEATGDCQKCNLAVARKGAEKCSKCLGEITSWKDEDENRDKTRVTLFCSWCLDESNHALRDKKKKQFQCLNCQSLTTPCNSCGSTAALFGEENECIRCRTPDWEAFLEKKLAYGAKYEDWDAVVAESTRQSEFREKARREGCLRPFLILAMMHPRVRTLVAMELGFVLAAEDTYMDAHGEAWTILSKSRKGIQDRVRGAMESMELVSREISWHVVLDRMSKMWLPKAEWPEAPSGPPGKMDVLELECAVYRNVLSKRLGTLSDLARSNFEALKNGPEYQGEAQRLRESPGYVPIMDVYTDLQLFQAFELAGLHNDAKATAEDGGAASVEMTLDSAGVQVELSKEDVTASEIMKQYAAQQSGYKRNDNRFILGHYATNRKAQGLAANVGAKVVVGAFFPVLGAGILASNIATAAYGDSLDVCVQPVREILMYQLLLQAKGVCTGTLF